MGLPGSLPSHDHRPPALPGQAPVQGRPVLDVELPACAWPAWPSTGAAHRDQEDLHALVLSVHGRDADTATLALSSHIWAHSLGVEDQSQAALGRITATSEDVSPAFALPQESRHTCRKVNIPGRNPDSLPTSPVCRAAALAPLPLR